MAVQLFMGYVRKFCILLNGQSKLKSMMMNGFVWNAKDPGNISRSEPCLSMPHSGQKEIFPPTLLVIHHFIFLPIRCGLYCASLGPVLWARSLSGNDSAQLWRFCLMLDSCSFSLFFSTLSEEDTSRNDKQLKDLDSWNPMLYDYESKAFNSYKEPSITDFADAFPG